MADQTLTVDFAGEVHTLAPGETLEFGRGAELDIDSNPYLHRRVGQFFFHSEHWFLANLGRSTHLVVVDDQTLSQATLAPGRELALTFLPATVRFRAGRATYELLVDGGPTEMSTPSGIVGPGDTVTVSNIPLTPDQRLLIVALAEQTLRAPVDGIQIPSNRQAAARLQWSLTKFNRKLDNVCAKLAKAGVPGLHGAPGALASSRRRGLVEFALQSGLVTTNDLTIMDVGMSGHATPESAS